MAGKGKRKRKSGAGSRPQHSEIEAQLIVWFRAERDEKRQVNYEDIRKQARLIASDLQTTDEQFPCSNKWIRNFCRRHSIGYRRITHRGQQTKTTAAEIKDTTKQFLTSAQHATAGLPATQVFNMDEVPAYFDMSSDGTLHFVGEKNVDGIDTGHRKSRFTVVLAISASGTIVKTLIIFKGLKNVPKVTVPPGIEVAVSMGGSMNTPLMDKWIRSCFTSRGNYLSTTKSVLFMDSYGTHMKPEVKDTLKRLCNTTIVFIPPGNTCRLQPLDVGVNSPFKTALRVEWAEWFRNGPQEFTDKGYRKRPSYQALIDMVQNALAAMKPEILQKSFKVCGIAPMGESVPMADLNERLRNILNSPVGLVEEQDVEEPENYGELVEGAEPSEFSSDEEEEEEY